MTYFEIVSGIVQPIISLGLIAALIFQNRKLDKIQKEGLKVQSDVIADLVKAREVINFNSLQESLHVIHQAEFIKERQKLEEEFKSNMTSVLEGFATIQQNHSNLICHWYSQEQRRKYIELNLPQYKRSYELFFLEYEQRFEHDEDKSINAQLARDIERDEARLRKGWDADFGDDLDEKK